MTRLQLVAAHPLPRFLCVGGALAAIYAFLTALATSCLDMPRPLIAALVWLGLIGPGYWCQHRFSFRSARAHRFGIWLYAGCQLAGMGIAAFLAWGFAQGRFWPDLLLFLTASALSALLSYLVTRLMIFPKSGQ